MVWATTKHGSWMAYATQWWCITVCYASTLGARSMATPNPGSRHDGIQRSNTIPRFPILDNAWHMPTVGLHQHGVQGTQRHWQAQAKGNQSYQVLLLPLCGTTPSFQSSAAQRTYCSTCLQSDTFNRSYCILPVLYVRKVLSYFRTVRFCYTALSTVIERFQNAGQCATKAHLP